MSKPAQAKAVEVKTVEPADYAVLKGIAHLVVERAALKAAAKAKRAEAASEAEKKSPEAYRKFKEAAKKVRELVNKVKEGDADAFKELPKALKDYGAAKSEVEPIMKPYLEVARAYTAYAKEVEKVMEKEALSLELPDTTGNTLSSEIKNLI